MEKAEKYLEWIRSELSKQGHDETFLSINEMKETPEWPLFIKAIQQAQEDAYNLACK